MAITSAKNDRKRYRNTQFRYGGIYIIITFIVLVFLNIYCFYTCQRTFYRSKHTEMTSRARILTSSLEQMDELSVVSLMQNLGDSHAIDGLYIMITDDQGCPLFRKGASDHDTPLLQELHEALDGNELFLWTYRGSVTYSEVAIPLYDQEKITGALYLLDTDPLQGALIGSLRQMILLTTVFLEVMMILFTHIFANSISSRIRKIIESMKVLKIGDYSHRVQLRGNDELAFLADEINDLTERLQTSERKRHQFISDASHELKTPLASIKLLTDSVLQNEEMELSIVREFVSDIGDEAARLIRMSEKMLTLTRSEAQEDDEPSQQVTLMGPTIIRVAKKLTIHAEANTVTIFTDVRHDIPVRIPEDDLYQIAFNLAENAIKYNVPGGILRIRLEREDGMGILIVEDSGTGIPKDALDHIYERFYRVDRARSRATGGSGLGLSIVRSMVERNDGTIHVESTFGQGTRFTVRFPAHETEGDRS